MTSIRKFVYTTLLVLTTVSVMPTLAAAEGPAHGEFKLTHEVHWQNAIVPAGKYRFTYDSDGASVLTLSKLSDPRTGFMILVSGIDDAPTTGVSRLTLESTPKGSYVSTMQLPESGVTLYFTVPTHVEKVMARTATTAASSGQ